MGYLFVALAALSWGTWSLFIRPSGLGGPATAAITFAVTSCLAPFVFSRAALRDRRATLGLLLLGVSDALNCALYFAACAKGSVVVAVLTHYLAPLLVALGAPWMLGEQRSVRAIVATPVVLGGLLAVVGRPEGAGALETALLGAGSAVFYALTVIGSKMAAPAYRPIQVMALHGPISLVVLLVLFRGAAVPGALDAGVWRMVLGGVLLSVVGGIVFNLGLRRIPSASAAALTYFEPLGAAVVGVAFWGEVLTPWAALGAFVVLAAGVWAALEPVRPAPPAAPSPAPAR